MALRLQGLEKTGDAAMKIIDPIWPVIVILLLALLILLSKIL